MKTLRERQLEFQNYLLKKNTAILSHLKKPAHQTVKQRIDIYRNGYYARFVDVLANDYPALKKILGEDQFAKLVGAYIQAHPSQFPSMHEVPRQLSTFLAGHAGVLPLWVEIAEFETALAHVSLAADSPVLTMEALAQVSADQWEDLQFQLHPSATVMHFAMNTPDVWRGILASAEVPITPYDTPQAYLVWRWDFQNYFAPISELAVCLLKGMQSNQRFGAICETLIGDAEDIVKVTEAAQWIRQWVEQGVIRT